MPAKPVATTGPGKPSILEEFWNALAQSGGAVRAQSIYRTAKDADRTIVLFPEGEMNTHGYQLLQEGRAKDAIIVFQMNVDAYPHSGPTQTSDPRERGKEGQGVDARSVIRRGERRAD